MSPMLSAAVVFLQKNPDPEDVKPGWLGLLMFLALVAAVVLLCLSLRKQLKKVDFEEEPDDPASPRAPGQTQPPMPS